MNRKTTYRKTTPESSNSVPSGSDAMSPNVSAVALPQMQNDYHAYLEGRTREQLIAECKRLHALSSQLEITCRTHLMLGMR